MILTFIGTSELLLIGCLALLLVGGKKLPEMMRGLGKGVREFKEGLKDVSPDSKRDGILNDDGQDEDVSSDPDYSKSQN